MSDLSLHYEFIKSTDLPREIKEKLKGYVKFAPKFCNEGVATAQAQNFYYG